MMKGWSSPSIFWDTRDTGTGFLRLFLFTYTSLLLPVSTPAIMVLAILQSIAMLGSTVLVAQKVKIISQTM
jgi:hypothetical protein